ncbi:beta strand repeat-containing protein [Dietzia lutea]|uniref:beta strand repeat-containing protein n=1 Tax=Dietzia lutea TaxID=546160 RepID=UPI001330641B|nr:Ig-like domain repeat protein [Dietzia lutea]
MLARNHQSGFPYTPSVLNTYGVTMPNGFEGVGGGGSNMENVGAHGRAQNNFWGGQPSVTDRPVARGSTRDGWLTMRIPENVQGGTVFQFGIMAHLGTGGSWNGPTNNVMRFTLPAVATTTQAVSVTPSTGRVGEDVTLSTRVSANHGTNTPTGTVRFDVDGQTLTANVVNGVATTTTSFSTTGSKSVTATYIPANSSQWNGSSRSGTVTIQSEATRTDLTLDPVEVLAGGTVQASASVTPAGAEGDIEFAAGGDPVRVPVGADGTATAELPADTTGEMTVTATFIPADPQRYTESSDSQTVDVFEQTATSTEVTADADPVHAGQETTLTASVSPSNAAGSVEFTIGDQTYPATVTGGIATLGHTFTSAGEHVVVVDFTPTNTDRFAPSTGQVTVTVEAEATQTGLTLDPVEVSAGGDISATAQITPADADGRVRFDYGNQTQTVDVTDGQATTTFTAGNAGTGTITATFLPADPARYTGSSDTQTVEIDAEATQIGLTLDANDVIEGDIIRASAIVTPAGAEGAVEFTAGDTTVSVPVGADGTATTDLEASAPGAMTVTATFIPADPERYAGSSDIRTVTVLEQVATATTLVAGADPVRADEEMTLTATVTPANVAGTITFSIDGQEYTATVEGGVATLNHTFATAGQYPVTAAFVPTDSDRYIASAGQATVNVEVEATQTALTLDPVEVTAGGEVTATARITPPEAAGRVRFDYGSRAETVDVAGGEATATFTAGNAGTDTITATFIPANPQRYTGSSDAQTVDITAEATRTELTLAATEVVEGSTFQASASVSPAGAEGEVQFTIGEITVSAPVDAEGTATADLEAPRPGEATVTATFVPADATRYIGSTDSQTITVIEQIATSTSVTVGTDQVRVGEQTTLTAAVTPADTAGIVTFTVGGEEYPVVVAQGVATLAHTFATAGDHGVTAVFTPTAAARYSSSGDELTVIVEAETTQTDLTLDAVEVTAGGTVRASATVTPAGAAGTIRFSAGVSSVSVSVPVAGDGTATAELPVGTAGQVTVTATFIPTNAERYTESSDSRSVDVAAETTRTEVTVDTDVVRVGEEATFTASVAPTGAAGAVTFTIGDDEFTAEVTDGSASLTHTFATAGEHVVVADFTPADPDRYASSTGRLTVDVGVEAAAEPTSVELDAGTVETGEEITLTATITPSGAEGHVRFTVDGDERLVPVVDGVAPLAFTAGERGTYTVRAEFVPADPDAYAPSAVTETLTVIDDDDPGTDPEEPATGSLGLVGLVASIAIGLGSSGSLGSLGS